MIERKSQKLRRNHLLGFPKSQTKRLVLIQKKKKRKKKGLVLIMTVHMSHNIDESQWAQRRKKTQLPDIILLHLFNRFSILFSVNHVSPWSSAHELHLGQH